MQTFARLHQPIFGTVGWQEGKRYAKSPLRWGKASFFDNLPTLFLLHLARRHACNRCGVPSHYKYSCHLDNFLFIPFIARAASYRTASSHPHISSDRESHQRLYSLQFPTVDLQNSFSQRRVFHRKVSRRVRISDDFFAHPTSSHLEQPCIANC